MTNRRTYLFEKCNTLDGDIGYGYIVNFYVCYDEESGMRYAKDISVIECIVGDKEVDDDDYFQVHSVYKQNLAILSNDIDYNYYPPIYLYDSQLVQVQFFDILLFISFHFKSPLFVTASFTL